MAFTQSTFAPVGANSTDALAVYSYDTSDTIATVTAEGYFVDKQFQLEDGDIILCNASDGFSVLQYSSTEEKAIDASFSASGLPALEITDDGSLSSTLNLISTVPFPITFTPADENTQGNNLFTDNGDGTVTYTGNPALLQTTCSLDIGADSSTRSLLINTEKNGGVYGNTPRLRVNTTIRLETISTTLPIMSGDVLGMALTNILDGGDIAIRGAQFSGNFKGWLSESDILGPELFENPNITSTDGFSVLNCTLAASGGELTGTATSTDRDWETNL